MHCDDDGDDDDDGTDDDDGDDDDDDDDDDGDDGDDDDDDDDDDDQNGDDDDDHHHHDRHYHHLRDTIFHSSFPWHLVRGRKKQPTKLKLKGVPLEEKTSCKDKKSSKQAQNKRGGWVLEHTKRPTLECFPLGESWSWLPVDEASEVPPPAPLSRRVISLANVRAPALFL